MILDSSKQRAITIDEVSDFEGDKKKTPVAEFYLRERKKISLWTIVFKRVNETLHQAVSFCEDEQQPEFARGVRETLLSFCEDLSRLEAQYSAPSHKKGLAWAVNTNARSLITEKDLKTVADEEEFEDFKLLDSLVNEGKISCAEAVVLLIRERAALVRLDSEELQSGIPMKSSLLRAKLSRRLREFEPQNDSSIIERVTEKHRRAEEKRRELAGKRVEVSEKKSSRISEIREMRLQERSSKQARLAAKEERCESNLRGKLESLKKRAQALDLKASEISVLQTLEAEHVKRAYFSRQKDNIARKEELRADMLRKLHRTDELALNAARQRREQLDLEKQEALAKSFVRIEEAALRRKKILSEKSLTRPRSRGDGSASSRAASEAPSFAVSTLISDKQRLDRRLRDIDGEELPCTPFLSRSLELPRPRNGSPRRPACDLRSSAYKFLTRDFELEDWIAVTRRNKIQRVRAQMLAGGELIPELPELLERERRRTGGENSNIAYCEFCDASFSPSEEKEHLAGKLHKKTRLSLALKAAEEASCISTGPSLELPEKRIAALRKKCRRLKAVLGLKSLRPETILLLRDKDSKDPKDSKDLKDSKDFKDSKELKDSKDSKDLKDIKDSHSSNKTRLQKLILELEKQLLSQQRDYVQLRSSFQEIAKILDKNREADLHFLRQARFPMLFTEFCKSVLCSPKFEIQAVVEILNENIGSFLKMCLLKENRSFLLLVNRVIPLQELVGWAFSCPTKLMLSLTFLPIALQILSLLLRHKLPPEHDFLRELHLEIFFFSGTLSRIREKLNVFATDKEFKNIDGLPGLIILKTLMLLESAALHFGPPSTSLTSPVNINPSVAFLCSETDMGGALQLLTSQLLSKGLFKPHQGKLAPTIQSISLLVIKILNCFARHSITEFQECFGKVTFNCDQLYHVVLFLLDYCIHFLSSNSMEIVHILHETILLIGYFTFENQHTQDQISRGTNSQSLVYKLANLPFQFFFSDPVLKELLFPTIINMIFNNPKNCKILFSEVSKELLVKYLEDKRAFYTKSGHSVTLDFEAVFLKDKIPSIHKFQQEFAFHKRFHVSKIDECLQFLADVC